MDVDTAYKNFERSCPRLAQSEDARDIFELAYMAGKLDQMKIQALKMEKEQTNA